MSEAKEYYKARGKMMFMLRQEYQCGWAPLEKIINRIGIKQYQAIIRYEKSASPTEKRLEWTIDRIRALTKSERVELGSKQDEKGGEDVGMHHKSELLKSTMEPPKQTMEEAFDQFKKDYFDMSKSSAQWWAEFQSAQAHSEAELEEAETMAAWAKMPQGTSESAPAASSSRSKATPHYEVDVSESEVEIEAEEESDDCIIIEEKLAMEPLAPLKRRRTHK